MKRITFFTVNFPKFYLTSKRRTYEEDFKDAGFKTAVREGYCLYSLSEKEYTVFVLRWS